MIHVGPSLSKWNRTPVNVLGYLGFQGHFLTLGELYFPAMNPIHQFKVTEAQKMSLEQLVWALKTNRVFSSPATTDCRENVAIYEKELAWRRQVDGPFR